MKYLKEKEKKKFPWVVVLILVIAVAASAAILIQAKRPKEQTSAAPVATAAQTVKTEMEAVPETTEEEYPPIVIETPYGDLYYPGQWAEGLRTEILGEDFDTSAVFYGTVSGEEYRLFAVHFGGAEGFPVGVLEIADGVMLYVTLEMADIEFGSEMSQEDIDRVCAMQEAMNYVMDHLRQNDSFTSAN